MSGDAHVRFCERPGVRLPRATHLVILVNGQWRNGWLLRAVGRRLREEFAKLDLRVNEAKSRIVDVRQGETFGFLGFDFRRVRSRRASGGRR
jgi:RNA-directed DNA polymerase